MKSLIESKSIIPSEIRTRDFWGNLLSEPYDINFMNIYLIKIKKYLIVRTFYDKNYLYISNISIVF